MTTATVLPVWASLPPMTRGTSSWRAESSFRVCLSSARSGDPGAWLSTGSLTGVGIFGMPFMERNLIVELSSVERVMTIHPNTRIGHIHLTVSDLDRALAFYRDVLGFEVTSRYGRDAVFLSAGGYHHHIGLNTWAGRGAPAPPPGTTGLCHFAVLYPGRPAPARAVRRVLDAAVPLEGAADHGVSEAIYLRDPDGNGVELYRDRPESEWPRAADGTIAMSTRALDLESLLAEAE